MRSQTDIPLAYFLTFTTHGARLHGDERGSVTREQNMPGTPMVPTNQPLNEAQRDLQKGDEIELGDQARSVILNVIKEVSEFRGWRLWAAHVRLQHIHIVVEASHPPERVMNDFKARATRMLREGGIVGADTVVWARHGSTRYLWDLVAVEAAIHYTLFEQGEPMNSFDDRS